jgi:hypothetical protein
MNQFEKSHIKEMLLFFTKYKYITVKNDRVKLRKHFIGRITTKDLRLICSIDIPNFLEAYVLTKFEKDDSDLINVIKDINFINQQSESIDKLYVIFTILKNAEMFHKRNFYHLTENRVISTLIKPNTVPPLRYFLLYAFKEYVTVIKKKFNKGIFLPESIFKS